MVSSEIEFSLTKPRYDLTTYLGRFKYFLNVCNPLAVLYTTDDINTAQIAIDKYKTTGVLTGNSIEMWNKLSTVNATIHPATNTIIPIPFRVGAIPVVNIPIVYFMFVIPSTNVFGTLLMHGINQSYNAACNYFNRAGEGVPIADMSKAYGLAVTSACTIAYGMGKLVEKIPKLQKYSLWIPILATAMASSSNIMFTRSDELKVGADIVDKEGNKYGKSIIAGKTGVMQTAISRCVMVPAAVMLLPNAIINGIKKRNLMPKNPTMSLLVQLSVIFAAFVGVLPATLAIFPQTIEYNPKDLEIEFHSLINKTTNEPITKLYSQKGL